MTDDDDIAFAVRAILDAQQQYEDSLPLHVEEIDPDAEAAAISKTIGHTVTAADVFFAERWSMAQAKVRHREVFMQRWRRPRCRSGTYHAMAASCAGENQRAGRRLGCDFLSNRQCDARARPGHDEKVNCAA